VKQWPTEETVYNGKNGQDYVFIMKT